MDIPESVKAVLRCYKCDELLSCGPVFLEHETSEAICGRCSHPLTQNKEDTPSKTEKIGRSRNLQYEAAAKLLSFPCRFKDQGCQEKLEFSEEESNIHERDCEFRTFNCFNCSKNFDSNSESEFCEECFGKHVKCKFGCSFVDFDSGKCRKHQDYFCEFYQTKCLWCQVKYVDGSFIEHLISSPTSHETILSNIDSVVRVKPNSKLKFIFFRRNNIETIICEYFLNASFLYFDFYTSLPSNELKNYKCSIEFTDPETKYTKIITPLIQYNCRCDWSIDEKMNNFPSCEDIGIDIKINMEKI